MRPPSKRLIAAAALSTVVHAALLGGLHIPVAEPVPNLPLLTARLEAQPAPVKAAVPQRAPTPRRASPQHAAAPSPQPVIAAAAATAAEESPLPAADPVMPAADPAMVASAAPTAFREPEEAPPLPEFPRKGRISYLLMMGSEQTPVGRTVQTWEFEGGRYRIGSQSESTGLVELFRPHRFNYLSQGAITRDGLRPERFLASIRRGSRSDEAIAEFDWEAGRVRLGRLPQQDTQALPAGLQDVISFMYHFALLPPAPGRIVLPFTRGARLETARFDVLPAESVDTPLGRLRTIPVVQVQEAGRESLAVWLATDYRNLPVRIRFFGRDGAPTAEQMVNEIQVGNP
jgi:hypothetical protein